MKLVVFGASSSTKSINAALAVYSANLFKAKHDPNAAIEVLNLNDFEMPIYSADREEANGIPNKAKVFLDKLGKADALVISYAEHNGSYTAAFKNIFDWASRINPKVYQGKKILALSASPGEGGAASVLASAKGSAVFFDANIVASLSVGSFYDVFDLEKGKPKDTKLSQKLEDAVLAFANT